MTIDDSQLHSKRTQPNDVEWMQDDVIDFRRLVLVPFMWWKEIALFTALLVLLSVGALYLLRVALAPVYRATADVAIAGTMSEVTLDDRFVTTADNPASNAAARRTSLLGLAESPSLAVEVINELGDRLSAEGRNPALLAARISAELQSNPNRPGESDLVRITATASDPERAALIADAWARAYVRNANQVYGQVPADMLASLTVEEQAAQNDYLDAQARLEARLGENRYDELSRQISVKSGQIDALQAGQLEMLNGLVRQATAANEQMAQALLDAEARNRTEPMLTQQTLARMQQLDYIRAVYANQSEVFHQQVQRELSLLQNYYAQSSRAIATRDAARSLRSQVEAAASVGGSALVADILQLQAYTNLLEATQSPVQQQNAPTTATTARTLDAPQAPATDGTSQATQLDVQVSSAPPQVALQMADSPLQVQLDLRATATREDVLNQLDALVTTLDQRIGELDANIAVTNERLLSGSQYTNLGETTPADSPLGALAAAAALGSAPSSASSTATSGGEETSPLGTVAPPVVALTPLLSTVFSDTTISAQVATMEGELRVLRSQLEREGAISKEISDRRDRAWQSYQAISSKMAELGLARAASNSVVRFAAGAVAPVEPIQTLTPPLAAGFALFAGILGGILLAFVLDMFDKRPFMSRPMEQSAGTPE